MEQERAANDERQPTPFEREIDEVSRFQPQDVLTRTPLEAAFVDSRACIDCGHKHSGWSVRCPICEDQHQREARLYR